MNYLDQLRNMSNGKKISVIGDTMIDRRFDVQSNRISQQAPIPVWVSQSGSTFKSTPGGAAKVATILCSICNNVSLYGPQNMDMSLSGILRSAISSRLTCLRDGCSIPIKNRFYINNKQVGRWDIQRKNFGYDKKDILSVSRSIFEQAQSKSLSDDVIIMSDYDKGVFSNPAEISSFIKKSKAKIIVDPKNTNISHWDGCFVIKPNQKQAFQMTGSHDNIQQMKIIMSRINCQNVIITKAQNGAIGMDKTGRIFTSNSHRSSSVCDPVGAGDCFSAMLASAIACNLSIEKAMDLAVFYSTEYVISPTSFYSSIDGIQKVVQMKKIVQNPNIFRQKWNGQTIGIANGCFDILHSGHVNMFTQAKSHVDKLIVAINSDQSVKMNKGDNRPVNSLLRRISVLRSIQIIDAIVVFQQKTPLSLIQSLRPDAIIKGGDYKAQQVVGNQISKVIITSHNGMSTTSILNRLGDTK